MRRIPGSRRRRRTPILVLGLTLIVLFLFFRAGVGVLMDWYWFQEVGYTRVFTTILWTQLALGLAVGIVAAGFIFANAALAIRGNQFLLVQRTPQFIELREISISPAVLRWATLAASLLVGIFAGLSAAGEWEPVMKYLHAQPFGKADPLLGHDIGFYI